MPDQKQERPRLIPLLVILLLLQVPVLVILSLNLLTDQWTFLFSWPVFWEEIQSAFLLVMQFPGEMVEDAYFLYSVVAFAVLALGAGSALISGILLHKGGVFAWIMGLSAQIITLGTGIILYIAYQPTQAYWLISIGILMVLYLNDSGVRQWLLQSEELAEVDRDA
jgi:hypothetical protein